jgi:tetratricopeptide (TPR) repeat protein
LTAAALGLVALRVVAMFVPGRWLWGLDLGRDLAPVAFVVPLLATLALCVPSVARALERTLPRAARARSALAVALALALAAFAWGHPDRALYTGDASLRHAAFSVVEHPEKFAEQAMRGDLLLHHSLPRWLATHTPLSAEQVGRAQGALLALLTALAGWRLARALGAEGALALGVMAVAAGTGALALDNGYAKASVEVACLTSIAAVGVARIARDGRGMATVGIAVGLALLLHRSALALLPAWAVCAVLSLRAGAWRDERPWSLAGLAAPPLALAIVGARLVHVLGTFDAEKHMRPGGVGATLAFALSPAHLLDVIHTVCLLVPIAPFVPLLAWLAPRASRRETAAWLGLALPPLAMLVLVNPQHGLARDWDVFAFAGSALAALAAWRLARVLGALPRAQHGLALAIACIAVVPALQWAALQSDSERMWSRAEAILLGPPERPASERADGLGTIGMMRFGRGQFAPAVRLFERSAAAAPNPRTFVEWGMAETMLGHYPDAMAHYTHAATLNPDLPTAWRGVAAAASALGDRASMETAARNLERLEPAGQSAHDARAWLEANPPKPER